MVGQADHARIVAVDSGGSAECSNNSPPVKLETVPKTIDCRASRKFEISSVIWKSLSLLSAWLH